MLSWTTLKPSTRKREVMREKDMASVLSDACYRLLAGSLVCRLIVLALGTSLLQFIKYLQKLNRYKQMYLSVCFAIYVTKRQLPRDP